MNLITEMARRWPATRAQVREFWDQQVRLQQRYLDRHDASGGDALDALLLQQWSRAFRAERGETFR
jgi:hypothetical protein